ncbi:MAG: hypothetical protein K2X48_02755 [Chitinophagaceae bacterium]|nr:hypothetical protein [Chitinophagaceae bacterium]
MKKFILTLILIAAVNVFVTAQTVREARKSVELKMPAGGGDNGGTVAINLKSRNLYATITGNKTYSMAFFNNTGEMVSPPDMALMADIRGLWYNPAQKTFHANTFGGGWVSYTMDEAGIPYDVKPLFPGVTQPTANSVGVYNQRENVVYFLKGSVVVTYDATTGKQIPEKTYALKLGYTKKNPAPADFKMDSAQINKNYNSTTVVFTGINNAEFGVLNVQSKEIELYSKQDGLMYQKLRLTTDAYVRDKFNFAFANNTFFLFDKSKRAWVGYR